MTDVADSLSKDIMSIRDKYGWNEDDVKEFWRRILIAIDVEPRDCPHIRGSSGLDHPVHGLGVDEKNGRVIVVSSDPDSRMAALMQSDIQSTFSGDVKVVVARPIVSSTSHLMQKISTLMGSTEIDANQALKVMSGFSQKDFKENPEVQKFFNEIIIPALLPYFAAPLTIFPEVLQIVRDISKIEFSFSDVDGDEGKNESNLTLRLSRLISENPLETDIKLGICGIPLYNFREQDYNAILNVGDRSSIQDALKKMDIYQYFFPPIDQVVLGICELYGESNQQVEGLVQASSKLGHIYDEPELLPPLKNVTDIIDALQQKKYIVESKFELGPEGNLVRANLKSKPREGFLSKIGITLNNHNYINMK